MSSYVDPARLPVDVFNEDTRLIYSSLVSSLGEDLARAALAQLIEDAGGRLILVSAAEARKAQDLDLAQQLFLDGATTIEVARATTLSLYLIRKLKRDMEQSVKLPKAA